MSSANDPQFGTVNILRPYDGWNIDYQGVVASTPIMFAAGGASLDALAGTPGYDPNLIKGTSVPMGVRCLFWLPNVRGLEGADNAVYEYRLVWRMRNLADYRRSRGTYHFPRSSQGVGTPPLVVKPSAVECLIYNQAEPALNFSGAADSHVRGQFLTTLTDSVYSVPPLVRVNDAPVPGVTEQGLAVSFGGTSFLLWDTYAKGDEVLVSVTRSTETVANWEFQDGEIDQFLRRIIQPNTVDATADPSVVGIYLMVGVT